MDRGVALWRQAVDEYKGGRKGYAYLYLGRSLHLLSQDLAQPGHVQNDSHVPYPGLYQALFEAEDFKSVGIALAQANISGVDGTGASTLEEKAEFTARAHEKEFPRGDRLVLLSEALSWIY